MALAPEVLHTATPDYLKNRIIAEMEETRDRLTQATQELRAMPVVQLTEQNPAALGRGTMLHKSSRGENAKRNRAIEKKLETMLPGGRQFLREIATIMFTWASAQKTGSEYDRLVRNVAYHAFLTPRNAGKGSPLLALHNEIPLDDFLRHVVRMLKQHMYVSCVG